MEERKKNLEKTALTEKQKLAAEKERQKLKDILKKQMEDVRLKQKEEKLKVIRHFYFIIIIYSILQEIMVFKVS